MYNSQNPIARRERLVVQEMPDEVLVYDLDSNKAHCLNQTAAFVWKNCDGSNSVADITANFEKVSGNKVTDDLIWLAIDQLNERNLLETEVKTKFAGQSRRAVLKKIGLASVVALPLIASLTAPTAALAVSCSGIVASCLGCPDGTPCDENGPGGPTGVCAAGACSGD